MHQCSRDHTTTLSNYFRCQSFYVTIHKVKRHYSLSESGARRITPLPVPIQSRLHDTIRELIRTNVKPSVLAPTSTISKSQFSSPRQTETTQTCNINYIIHILNVYPLAHCRKWNLLTRKMTEMVWAHLVEGRRQITKRGVCWEAKTTKQKPRRPRKNWTDTI